MRIITPDWFTLRGELCDLSGTLWVSFPSLQDLVNSPGPHFILLVEPSAIAWQEYKAAETIAPYCKQILTFSSTLLSKLPNATCVLYGTTWIDQEIAEQSHTFSKQPSISFVCGDKADTYGHLLRRGVYQSQNYLSLSTKKDLVFFRSCRGQPLPLVSPRGNPFLYQDKSALHLPFQYSIIIENSDEPNYFSEKLLDCILCRTVPIYWGCQNIETFFNPKGLLLLKGEMDDVTQQLLDILPTCTEKLYTSMQPYLEENYKRSYLYAYNYNDRVVDAIQKCYS